MSGSGSSVTITGDAAQQIAALLERLQKKQPVLKAAGRIVQQSVKRNFVVSGRPKKWAALKRPSKRRGGKSAKPLVDTARLMNSFTSNSGDAEWELKESELDVGTNVEYAKYHDPTRPFMLVQDEDVEDIQEFIQDYYVG
jgi:phage gpG-like protein